MIIICMLCFIVLTLQIFGQDKKNLYKNNYINELCAVAQGHNQEGAFDLALHNCNTAMRFYHMHHLQDEASLCKIWTQLGHVYYTRWLCYNKGQDLAQASENLQKAVQYEHIPALEVLGILLMGSGNFCEAVRHFKKVVCQGLNRGINYRRMGICYEHMDYGSHAIKYFWKAYNHGDYVSLSLLQSLRQN